MKYNPFYLFYLIKLCYFVSIFQSFFCQQGYCQITQRFCDFVYFLIQCLCICYIVIPRNTTPISPIYREILYQQNAFSFQAPYLNRAKARSTPLKSVWHGLSQHALKTILFELSMLDENVPARLSIARRLKLA